MKKPVIFIILMIFANSIIMSQTVNTELLLSEDLKIGLNKSEKSELSQSINDFFFQIGNKMLSENLISDQNKALSISCFTSLSGMEFDGKKDTIGTYRKKVINCYPLNEDHFFTSISFVKENDSQEPTLKLIYSFIISKKGNKYQYSIPLNYHTRHWKNEKIGNITYFYRDKINQNRAEAFDKNNTLFAQKFNLEPEQLDFYMTENYQELNSLLGFDYELSNAGKTRDGYGVDSNSIFAIQNNEDFSHDIFHFYSGKVNERMNRNWVSEEGVAYYWGNAYYTDKNGDMINQKVLVEELKKYLKENNDVDLLSLFKNNDKIFPQLAEEAKARSVISGILCKEVERKFGMEGLQKMINAGSKERMKKYFVVLDELLSVNESNFHNEVMKLIAE